MRDVKVGDVVHVRGEVIRVGSDVYVAFNDTKGASTANALFIRLKDIVHVETRPLQVGDVVTWGHKMLSGRILAIDDGVAWVKIESGGHCQVDARTIQPLDQLERV